MSKALFVVSEHGYWGEEFITPLERLSEQDVEITVATPTGGKPRIDERSVDPENVGEEEAEHIQQVHESDERIQNPIPVAEARAEQYEALILPGGHGTLWDINQDHHVRSLLRDMLDQGGHALVICHAVGIFGFARDRDGAFLVDGRRVTGFPNEWEQGIVDGNDLMPDGRKLPYWVEDEVKAAGGEWDAELDQDVSVNVDRNLITARGPESSEKGAVALVNKLSATQPTM